MSQIVYFIRHAQSRYNLAELQAIQKGEEPSYIRHLKELVDAEITDFGQQQVQNARQVIQQIHFDKIFVSPLYRALQTCQGLFKNHPSNPQIQVIPYCSERFGSSCDISNYDGQPYQEFSHFDWNYMSKFDKYWIFEIIKSEKMIKYAKEYTKDQDFVDYLCQCIKETVPEDIERPAEILWRKEKLFEKISKEPNGSTVGIVGHSMFFLDLTGDFLENCGFKQYTLDFLMNR